MPNLNALDDIGDISDSRFTRLLNSLTDEVMESIRIEEKPLIRAQYNSAARKITLDAVLSGVEIGLRDAYLIPSIENIGKYYLNTQYEGSTLSDRIYRDAQAAQRAVESTVKDHIKARTNWQSLTKDIKRKAVPVGDIPGYLEDIEKAFKDGDIKGLKSSIRKANRRIKLFTNEKGITRSNLKKAYSDVVKAAEKGDAALLEKKINIAIKKKAINNSQRTARTELSRAYFDAEMRRMHDDPDIIAYRSVLSPSHPRPDQCNYYAEVDAAGMGPGVWPKTISLGFPYHSRCICMLEDVVRKRGETVGRFSKERSREYLQDLKSGGVKSQEKLKGIMGVEGSKNLSEWEDNLKGWEGVTKSHALPKRLVVKK
jgi:hypothetical protein